ncbi:cell wall-active antibiotics response protein [Bacillaceae bacterium Marseille-Q3522]|nr:cell wall-active antibiotics response protein [Bacillaceae bacterium Marseille-Q3522]
MFQKMRGNQMNWVVLAAVILLMFELTFFNHGLLFIFIVCAGFIYIGKKRIERTFGKILFWLGIILLIINIFNMFTMKVALIGIAIYFALDFIDSKKKPHKISPDIVETEKTNPVVETLIRRKPLIETKFFGPQKTPEYTYEWNDINIQTAFGDTVIDFTNTVLPKGESVVCIRQFFGNVTILVPYEIEMNIHHSVLFGDARILGLQEGRLYNTVLNLQTEHYDQEEQKIKLFTSFFIGDIEVKRV